MVVVVVVKAAAVWLRRVACWLACRFAYLGILEGGKERGCWRWAWQGWYTVFSFEVSLSSGVAWRIDVC